jgi:autotransporter translocation and assembly factor TamB
MKIILRSLLRSFSLAILICIAALLYFITQTNSGLTAVISLASSLLPGTLHIEKVKGRLFSAFELKHILYHSDLLDVTIDDVKFKWNPHAALHAVLDIDYFVVSKVNINAKATKTASDTNYDLSKLKFLKHLRISQLVIDKWSYAEDQGSFKDYPLSGKIDLDMKQNVLYLNNFQLNMADSNFHAKGTLSSDWNLLWETQTPHLGFLGINAKGSITSQGQITGPKLTPLIKVDLQANQLAIADYIFKNVTANLNFNFKPNTATTLAIKANDIRSNGYLIHAANINVEANTQLTKQDFLTHLVISLNNKPYLLFSISVPNNTNLHNYTNQPITAKLKLTISDFSDLTKFIPDVAHLQGQLLGNLDMTGTVSKPMASGTINLTNGSVTIPAIGITIKNIQLHFLGNNQSEIVYQGKLESGKGVLNLAGTTHLLESSFPTNLHLAGKNLLVTQLPEYKIEASPDLTLHYDTNYVNVTGKLDIPYAKIYPKDFQNTVTLPDDVVFIDHQQITPTSFLSYIPELQVEVTLGENVAIRYQNLETLLRGKLHLSKTISSLLTANGELHTVKGSYKAYNKILTIRATKQIKIAEMSTAGNFASNTASAVYQSAQYQTVGVNVSGYLNNPIITLYSDPPLANQKDILSYLAFGLPASAIKDNAGQALLSAFSAMNIGDNNSLQLEETLKKVQNSLGLTELNVESVNTFDPNNTHANPQGIVQTKSVIVGKKLAPNLYLHSSIGSFDQQPIINLRYILSKHWSVQSEKSSIDTGADLLFSIERE